MQNNKFAFKPLKILIVLIVLLSGCWPFGSAYESTDVEVIVPDSEKPSDWILSPDRDKIVYQSHTEETATTFLLFLATQQKHKLDDCDQFQWLDNTILKCPSAIINTDDLFRVPLQYVNASDVDLEKLLQEAGTIYKFEATSRFFLVLDAEYRNHLDKNYLVSVENVDTVLQGYPYITIPNRGLSGGSEEKVYSPDGAYYYNLSQGNNASLTIYAADDDKKLAEFVAKPALIIITEGWAADSSGVYIQLHGTGIGFTGNLSPKTIWKLEVPD